MWRFAFQKATGLEQRQHLSHQGFGQGALLPRRYALRQVFWMPGEAVSQAAYNPEPLWQGLRRPGGLRLTRNLQRLPDVAGHYVRPQRLGRLFSGAIVAGPRRTHGRLPPPTLPCRAGRR